VETTIVPPELRPGVNLSGRYLTDQAVRIPPNVHVDLTGADLRDARIDSRALIVRAYFTDCLLKGCEVVVDFETPTSPWNYYIVRSQGAVLINAQTDLEALPRMIQERMAVLSTLPEPGELDPFGAKLAEGIYIVETLRKRSRK
jgi:hypothetical protein